MKTALKLVCFILFCHFSVFAQNSLYQAYFAGGVEAYQQGKYAESERLFRAAISELGQNNKQSLPASQQAALATQMVDALNGLSAALQQQGKLPEAEKTNRESLALIEMVKGKDSPEYAVTLNNLGLCLSDQGKFAEAEKVHRQALALKEKLDGPNSSNVAISLLNIGKIAFDQGRLVEAETLLNRTVQILLNLPESERADADADSMLLAMHNLSLIYTRQKQYDLAERTCKLTIGVASNRFGPDHPEMVKYVRAYAALLKQTGRTKESAKYEAIANQILSKQ